MTGADRRVPVPLLRTRASTAWVLGTAVVALAVVTALWVTQPQNRWTAAVLGPLFVVALVGVLGQRCWLNPASGVLTWQRFGLWRVTLPLEKATAVVLVGGGGAVLLRVWDGRRSRHVPLLALTQHVRLSQSSALLTLIADCLEREVPSLSRDVLGALRAQARHVAAGGRPETSPLAAQAGGTRSQIVAGGGALGGGSTLLP